MFSSGRTSRPNKKARSRGPSERYQKNISPRRSVTPRRAGKTEVLGVARKIKCGEAQERAGENGCSPGEFLRPSVWAHRKIIKPKQRGGGGGGKKKKTDVWEETRLWEGKLVKGHEVSVPNKSR